MSSLNKVFLIGNLGADPRLDSTRNTNQSVCNFSVATSRYRTNSSGSSVEETQWHRVVVWGSRAEACAKYLSKGSKVHIEGRLETKKWTDKDGGDHYTTQVVAENVTFMSQRRDS